VFWDDEERFMDRAATIQIRVREGDVFDAGVQLTEQPTLNTKAMEAN